MSRKGNDDEKKTSCLLIGTEPSFLGDSKRESIFILHMWKNGYPLSGSFFKKKEQIPHWDIVSDICQIMAAVSQKKKNGSRKLTVDYSALDLTAEPPWSWPFWMDSSFFDKWCRVLFTRQQFVCLSSMGRDSALTCETTKVQYQYYLLVDYNIESSASQKGNSKHF